MKYLAVTLEGMEDISALEITEKTGSDPRKISKTLISFDVKKIPARVKFQSLTKLLQYLSIEKFKDVPNFSGIDFSGIKEPFKVKCKRTGNHNFTSSHIEKQLGGEIHETYKKSVDVISPATIVYVHIYENTCAVGIETSEADIFKRSYRLKTTPGSLNPCVEYAAVRISGYSKGNTLIDPLCKTSEILIESGLHAEGNLKGLDEFYSNIKSSGLNARIADVHLDLYHGSLDWVQTKFKEKSADCIITSLIIKKDKLKLRELFKESEYVLKDKGTLTLISNEELSPFFNFRLKKKLEVVKGQKYFILVFEKLLK